jgi:DNA repair exonuclease SbcCD ATPase subunit
VTVRLTSIELSGFRGFATRCAVDLDADAVVIRGDNGTGKTSIVDGLLWLLSGELHHLVERQRGLRRTEDVVTSRFNPGGASVALSIAVDGRNLRFTRTGNQRATHLSAIDDAGDVRDGADAEALLADSFQLTSPAQLGHAVTTWGLLRQDALRTALENAGGALHERVAGLIGLESVSRFAAATTRASDGLLQARTAAQRARERAAERHRQALDVREAAQRDAGSAEETARLLADGMAAVQASLPPFLRVTPSEPLAQQRILELARAIESVLRSLEQLRAAQRALTELPEDPEALVEHAERELAEAAQAASAATESAPIQVQLASAATQLLGDRCPVCDQPIDEASVRQHLQEVLGRAEALLATAQQTQERLASAQSSLARARNATRERQAALERVTACSRDVRLALGAAESLVQFDAPELDASTVDTLMQLLPPVRERLESLSAGAPQASDAHVARLDSEVDAVAAELVTAEKELAGVEARCKHAKALEHAARDAAQHVLEEALTALRPSFAEVFDRLAPNPAFTELLARQDVLRNRNQIVPMVRDRERDLEANPLLIFSEGQLNVVALSYFLGMALNAREATLPFMVLDDPLQALDVISILGLSDLCRQIRDLRQLIITTHDRRFADVLVRKLSPRDAERSLIVHELEGWTRDGPVLRTSVPELAPVIPLLRRKAS